VLETKEALDVILGKTSRLGVERVSLLDALGRVLAEDIHAARQQPPWDNSAMDGYAVRAADVQGATPESPVRLRVVEEILAGDLPRRRIGSGEASRIMTGAPIPEGADAVVRVEDTDRGGDDVVLVRRAVKSGRDIRRAGEDQEVGDLLVPAGKSLRPGEIGVIAGAPRSFVTVYRRPVVAVIATGDELAEPDTAPGPSRIVNTSSYSIAAMVQDAGARPVVLPIARDDRGSLEAAFAEALRADVVVSVGGVSMGERDLVRAALEAQGVSMHFWKVRVTPGKPLAFGTAGSRLVFGLPGNPVSCMVSFELFVRPALLKLAGHRRIFRRALQATLTEGIPKRKDHTHYLRVRLEREGGGWKACSVGPQGSGILRSMTLADGLAVGPREALALEAGAQVWVLPLDDLWAMSEERPDWCSYV